MALILVVLLLPISVYAGVMGTLFNNVFKNSKESAVSLNDSAHNMALLVSSATLPGNTGTNLPSPVQEDVLVYESVGTGESGNSSLHRPTSDQINIYVVREGDTLSQIAEMFDVTVNTIKWSNDLKSNVLREGEVLVILPISGVRHTVAKGDTIASIAKKYKGDSDEILSYNNLEEGGSLAVGEVIIIPDGEVVSSSSSSPSSKPSGGGSSVSSSLVEYSGFYIRPMVGGRRSQGIHGYNAVDIAAPVGTSIMAAADGEVIISRSGGWNGGYGNYIVIKHSNGTQTLYSHNSKNFVSVGDTVNQGDVIGAVGNTGKTTGAHLHFEIRGAKNPF